MVGVKRRSRVILQVRMRGIHPRNPADHHRLSLSKDARSSHRWFDKLTMSGMQRTLQSSCRPGQGNRILQKRKVTAKI